LSHLHEIGADDPAWPEQADDLDELDSPEPAWLRRAHQGTAATHFSNSTETEASLRTVRGAFRDHHSSDAAAPYRPPLGAHVSIKRGFFMRGYNVAGYALVATYAVACMYFAPPDIGLWTGLLIGAAYFVACWFVGGLYLSCVIHMGIAHRAL